MKTKLKIKDLVGDLTYDEIKERRWRIPRLWRDGKLLFFYDYIISDDGMIIRVTNGGRFKVGKKIKLKRKKNRGYISCNLSLAKKQYAIYIHRILYETFIEIISEDCEINHMDGDKPNFNPFNLEAITHKENCQHANEMGLSYCSKSYRLPVEDIRSLYWKKCGLRKE